MVIIRLDAIGDYILFRNFIKIIKESEKFRDYKISLVGNIIWKDIAENFDKDYIYEFIWVDKSRFSKRSEWLYTSIKLLEIHSKGFDVLIKPNDMNSRLIDEIINRSGVSNRISEKGILIPFDFKDHQHDNFLNNPDDIYPQSVFQFYRNKTFIESIIDRNLEIKKPFFDISNKTSGEKYFVIFPGAGDEKRKWSVDNFAELCKQIRETSDKRILICGSAKDNATAEKIIRKSEIKNIEDMTGKTSLTELVKIISDAELVISNETCAVHIGAAVNAKTICISNGNHFGRFNPYPEEMAPFVITIYPDEITNDQENYAGLVKKFFISSDININTLSVKQVFEKITVLLNKEKVF